MRAPPSDFGAVMFSVAVPDLPTTTDLIDGDAGGPKGLCQLAVVWVFELQAARVRIVCNLELLLTQVCKFNNLDPGVPEGAEPFWNQVLAS